MLSQLTLPSAVEMMAPRKCDILIFCSVLVLISESPDLKGKQILVCQLGEKLVSFPASHSSHHSPGRLTPAWHRWAPINVGLAVAQGGIGFPHISLGEDCPLGSVLSSCQRAPAFDSNRVDFLLLSVMIFSI